MASKFIVGIATIVAVLEVGFCFPSDSKVKNYDGFQVLRADLTTKEQFQAVQQLALEDKYDFWVHPRPGRFADIMAGPEQLSSLKSYLKSSGVPFEVMIENLESLVIQERQRRTPLAEGDMDWDNYHRWQEINAWLSKLVSTNSMITQERYGTSYEGRDLHVYKVSTGSSGQNTTKPAFWIDATIHAREHITTAVITYIINQLVTNSSSYSDILNGVDFYFAPFINPDGYEYTFTTDRMWRRTRSDWSNGTTCLGVDANRNFGFQFGGPGSSGSPCSETYRGPAAYSEPETNAVKNYIVSKTLENVRWEAFITLHSYSQLWMTPYGYTLTPPQDYAELKQLGDEAVAALKSHFGTDYQVGNAGDIIYLSSGSSRDWAKGEGGFKWVYTIELRDTGRYGFILPPDQIMPSCIETWSGIQVVARKLLEV